MSEGKQYKPVGGVVAAELFAVRGLASPAQMTAGTGTAVELCDAGCSYSETFTVAGWSPRFGFEQALRLRSLALRSGAEAVDEPHAELTLAATDTSRAAARTTVNG